MVKKLDPKPEFDSFQFAGGELGYLYSVEEWADKLHTHHIEETTDLVQKLKEVRKELSDLKENYSQVLYEKALNAIVDDDMLLEALKKERARVDELLRKNTQLVNEKREALYQARDQKVLNDTLLRRVAELEDPLYVYNTPGTREAVQKVFNSTPEELAEAAIMGARQQVLADKDMCKWCTSPPSEGDSCCASCRENMRKMSTYPTRTEAEQAVHDDPDAP